MTTAGFHEVVEALSSPSSSRADPRRPAAVTVLGSGSEGRALAAWFLAEGATEVRLFTVYGAEVDALAGGSITLRGEGPVGTFRVGGDAPTIEVTSVLDRAVAASDIVVVSGPVLKQRTYGLVLAQQVQDGQTVVVTPSATFGGLETAHLLAAGGSTAEVAVVELGSLPFDVAEAGGTLTLTRRRPVVAGVLPHRSTSVLEGLAHYFPDLAVVPTLLHSSFADGSGLVELPALLMGGPAMPGDHSVLPPGAVPVHNGVFRSLIGDRHASVISELADERRAVASRFGVRDLPGTKDWIVTHGGDAEGAGVRVMPSPGEAIELVRNGVLGSLGPLLSAAQAAGVEVPATRSMMHLAEASLGTRLGPTARSLGQAGLSGRSAEEIRRVVESGGR